MLLPLHFRRQHIHLDSRKISFNLCRFAEILGAIGFSATGETVISGITGDPGNLIVHSVAAQHAKMPVMIDSTGTFRLIIHFDFPLILCVPASNVFPSYQKMC